MISWGRMFSGILVSGILGERVVSGIRGGRMPETEA